MADWTPPSQTEVEGYFERLKNWGRWGADDQRGSLNLISPEKQAAAVALATACKEEGRSEFLFSAMPLRIVGSTGSPCQPVAIF
jgi:hypothetical protein